MEKNNTEVANISRTNEINGEDIMHMLGGVVDTIIGLSQKVAENNAARYQAEAEVLIEELKCRMETEIQEIEKYSGIREKQEENVQMIIDTYNVLVGQLLQAGSEPNIEQFRRELIIKSMDSLQNTMDTYLRTILNEQNTHLNTIQKEKKGIFGFLKKKD